MKKLFALSALVVFVSGSAFAQAPRGDDRYDQPRAQTQRAYDRDVAPRAVDVPETRRTTPEEGRRRGSEMSRERFDAWQNKKRQCYLNAGLTEGKHFRAVEGGMKFQVNSVVHLGGFDSAAVDRCDAL
jgi:hypothetical protein